MKVEILTAASALAGVALGRITLDPSYLTGLTGIMPSSMLASGVATQFTKNMVNAGYGKTGGLFSSFSGLSQRTEMTAKFATQFSGSKTVKIRYGPYTVPSMNRKNGFGEGGTLWNYPDTDFAKPCDKCVVLGMTAGLEYQDGKNANIDTGAWLHHMVLFNVGAGRVDQTCMSAYSSLPHANVGCTPTTCERFFASGNERTPVLAAEWAGPGKKPVGYHLKPYDKFVAIVDLMNDSTADKTVYITMTWDYVDGYPSGMDDMRPVWFDVDQCGLSEAAPKAQSGSFDVRARAWTATMNGEVLGWGGHLHDGGLSINMDVNGMADCNSDATYGGDKAFIADMATMGNMKPNSATVHISKMTICQGNTVKTRQMKKGQQWTLTAKYDYNKHKGVLDENGRQDSIMGIAIMFVRQPWNG